ncbi:DUF3426 domain-containing protein [Iodobacter violaceini]|uniref:DUF3426 domain-containing protein n=1 Tax=Iodobacter violaceini TaxID=3044271 RepID=UPI00197C439D|nr:DUF3426 domain-containing protein [Iodobacter violacea]
MPTPPATEPAADFAAMGLAVKSNSGPAEEPFAPTEFLIEAEPEPENKAEHPAESDTHHNYRPIYTEVDETLLDPPPARSRWQGVWIAACLILICSFAAQLAYQQRTNISMEFPWMRPKLIAACHALGCSMPLPENAEMLRSEWSELSYVPEFPNIIQLNATLRNLAQYEQALPMLEVTLTDDQEKIVLKKVFKPAEYLSSHDKNRLKFDAQDDLRAFLQIDLGELHSTAYSIYWFYP